MGEHDEPTREYMCRYPFSYALLLYREPPCVEASVEAEGEVDTMPAQRMAGAMQERATMCARTAGLKGAGDIYARLSQLAGGCRIPFPGLAPRPLQTEPLVRKVMKGGRGVSVQGVGKCPQVLGHPEVRVTKHLPHHGRRSRTSGPHQVGSGAELSRGHR